ncbi:alpha/beta fold hydrolase [Kordia sp. YSTF-M3]|uniref:Alpha/beta fold hydrolase n=1 Tax=Kordia aestuariivivens TaxID=2759037 RepID=A0ABR7Q3Y5_9FLAO|nr:alpha/beta fold hydrolase [Kordia aestuariivivens]MBC8753267.1 alpha/beta fold hydrolase [Kordia aestuariivivens]
MREKIAHISITDFFTESGAYYPNLKLSYQLAGSDNADAPIVLVNHALTGNSEVTGENGWWKSLIGDGKCIDTNHFKVLSFDIPGNGFLREAALIKQYKDFVARDIAKIFIRGLEHLKINTLFAAIGGSLGGGIVWEMAVLEPNLIQNLIPIASDWKSTDWLIANCFLQERILENSSNPIEDARIHAMLCYRTPFSLKVKFQRTLHKEKNIFNTESWLLHHGEKLQQRFQLSAYKLMNQLLKTIDITRGRESLEKVAAPIAGNIHIISINSDIFFSPDEDIETYRRLKRVKANVYHDEIQSIHGHDAFLMEYRQLSHLLRNIFQVQKSSI